MKLDAVRPPTWLRWVAVAVVAGGILFASVLDPPSSAPPTSGTGPGGIGMDKWLHALAYAGLAGTLAVALASDRGRSPAVARDHERAPDHARTAALAALLAVCYGVGLEFVQAPLAGRYFSVADMVADAVGAAVAVVGWRLLVGRLGGSRGQEQSSESEL
ncbi:VanZ family protein [Halorussus caseinilyticus]|uniref:VanZ family protein n=1 Tax=Halorussus caseinilyticus TaxID=3034025 RepID=A0ABD5WSN7_9EURY|nr:VanZ family protein [Halorussus sp. DT72]